MRKVPVTDAREDFSELINQIAYGGERLILQRRGKDVVAMISIDDLALLEALEDKMDVEAAKKALKEAQTEGTIPWEKVKEDLDL